MALIKCPECGKEISDKAKDCPNCGYPIESIQDIKQLSSDDEQTRNEKPKQKKN